MDMTNSQRDLALQLFDIGAVEFGAFKLKLHETSPNAPLSPIFFNLRTPGNPKPGPLTPEIMRLIGTVLYQQARASLNWIWECRYLAGIPNAGDPFAEALNQVTKAESGYWLLSLKFRKENLGPTRRIGEVYEEDGELIEQGALILLVDDLITKADTKIEAIKSAEAAGLKVGCILVLVDRERGGRQELEKAGYLVISVFKLTDLLTLYVETGRIDQAMSDKVRDYLRDNQ